MIHIHEVQQERTLLETHSVSCGEFTTYDITETCIRNAIFFQTKRTIILIEENRHVINHLDLYFSTVFNAVRFRKKKYM
jgi:hypothetical protein